MRKISIVKADTVEVRPFVLADFIQAKETQCSMKKERPKASIKISKKRLKHLAKELGLDYDEKQIIFAKKLLTAYLEQQERLGKHV